MRAPEVAIYVGISETAWRRLVATGKAPKPVLLGRTPIWLRDVVDGWLSGLAGVPHQEPAEGWQKDLETWVP